MSAGPSSRDRSADRATRHDWSLPIICRPGVDSTVNVLAVLIVFATVGLGILADRMTHVEL